MLSYPLAAAEGGRGWHPVQREDEPIFIDEAALQSNLGHLSICSDAGAPMDMAFNSDTISISGESSNSTKIPHTSKADNSNVN